MSEDTPKHGMGEPDCEKEDHHRFEPMAQFNREEIRGVAR
jgi:hypothetical protein